MGTTMKPLQLDRPRVTPAGQSGTQVPSDAPASEAPFDPDRARRWSAQLRVKRTEASSAPASAAHARDGLALTRLEEAYAGLAAGGDGALRELLGAYGQLADKRAAVAWLRERNADLAEAVVLFGDRSDAKAAQAARHHMLINGSAAPRDGGDAASVLGELEVYARTLGYADVKLEGRDVVALTGDKKVTLGRVDDKSSAEALLRKLGQKLNLERFGTERVVPPAMLPLVTRDVYDRVAAHWLAHLSSAAYADRAQVIAQARAWGFSDVRWITAAGTDTQALIAVRDDVAVVAFRGTSSFADFKLDAQFGKTAFDGGEVHSGFHKAFTSIWPKLQAELAELGDKPLLITGHSLGGALAQLTAYAAAKAGKKVSGVYTFGAPRIGDARFAAAYNRLLGARTYAHVNNRDAVARVPPGWLGYAEVGFAKYRYDDELEIEDLRRRNAAALAEPLLEGRGDPAAAHRDAVLAIEGLAGPTTGQGDSERVAAQALWVPGPFDDHKLGNYLGCTGGILLEQVLGLERRLAGRG